MPRKLKKGKILKNGKKVKRTPKKKKFERGFTRLV